MPSEFHTEFARNTFNFSSRLLIAIPTRAVGLKGELKSALVFESLRCGSFQSINQSTNIELQFEQIAKGDNTVKNEDLDFKI